MKKTDRERLLFLLGQAIKNAPVNIAESEKTPMLRSISIMNRRSHEENIRQLKKFLLKRYKRKTPKVSPPVKSQHQWSVLYGRFRNGKKH
jgi:hypothetical protein